MEGKKISVTTVAKRMNRILAAYREQCVQEKTDAAPVASTSSSSSSSSSLPSLVTASNGELSCTPKRKMVLDKTILNYAAHMENESHSESDATDYSFDTESPPKRRCQTTLTRYMKTVDKQQEQQRQQQKQPKRRRQPSRTVKRAAVKLTSMPCKRVQRNVTCTVTSNASPDGSNNDSFDDESDPSMGLIFPESGNDDEIDSDAVPKPVKSSFIIKATPKTTRVQPMEFS